MVNPENPVEFITAHGVRVSRVGIVLLPLGAVLITLALLWR